MLCSRKNFVAAPQTARGSRENSAKSSSDCGIRQNLSGDVQGALGRVFLEGSGVFCNAMREAPCEGTGSTTGYTSNYTVLDAREYVIGNQLLTCCFCYVSRDVGTESFACYCLLESAGGEIVRLHSDDPGDRVNCAPADVVDAGCSVLFFYKSFFQSRLDAVFGHAAGQQSDWYSKPCAPRGRHHPEGDCAADAG